MLQKNTQNPLGQQVNGVLVLQEGEEACVQAETLMETLRCKVLKSSKSRLVVKTSRGNLMSIKNCWLLNDKANGLSQELNECIQKIIIGGRA